MRVAVIGAGVVGTSVAYQLARRGVEVTLFDRHRPGYGTSSTTFGWINSHRKRPDSYHRLNVEGCEEHRRFAESDDAVSPAYFRTGNVEWVADAPERERLDERVSALDALGYPVRWLEPTQLRALEPDVLVPDDVERIAFFPLEGHVLPMVLLARLLGAARDHGARLRCPVGVRAITPGATGVEVGTDDNSATYDRVVCCAGRWTGELAASAGIDVPMVDAHEPGGKAVGYLAYTAPAPARLSRVLTTPGLNVRPDGGGRLVLQSLDLDGAADPAQPPAPDSSTGRTFATRLGGLLANCDAVPIVEVRVGQRSIPADGLPVVGYCDPDRRLYIAATHSGMTLGPLLGRLVADEIVDDTTAPLLADFRPDRLADVN